MSAFFCYLNLHLISELSMIDLGLTGHFVFVSLPSVAILNKSPFSTFQKYSSLIGMLMVDGQAQLIETSRTKIFTLKIPATTSPAAYYFHNF